jgi:integrase
VDHLVSAIENLCEHLAQLTGLLAHIRKSANISDMQAGRDGTAAHKDERQGFAATSIDEAVSDWLASRARLSRDPKAERQNSAWIRQFTSAVGVTAVEQITTKHIERYLAGLSEMGRASSTVNNHLSTIRQFCRWARRFELLQTDPARDVMRASGIDRGEGNATFSPEQAAAVVLAARRDEQSPKPKRKVLRSRVYTFAWCSGLRRKELGVLRWRDILGLGTPDVHMLLTRPGTKNRKGAALPLHPAAAKMLVALREQNDPEDRDLVFGKLPHHRVVAFDILSAGWVKHTKTGADGLIPVDDRGNPYGMHSFRKGFDTALIESGAELPMAMKLMRHSDPRLTAGLYNRARLKPLRNVLSQLPAIAEVTENPQKSLPETDPEGVDKPKKILQDTSMGVRHDTHTTTNRGGPEPIPPDFLPDAQGCERPGPSGSLHMGTGRRPTIAGAGFEPAPGLPGSDTPVLGVFRIEIVVRLPEGVRHDGRSNPHNPT